MSYGITRKVNRLKSALKHSYVLNGSYRRFEGFLTINTAAATAAILIALLTINQCWIHY
jgi:TolB-like protein